MVKLSIFFREGFNNLKGDKSMQLLPLVFALVAVSFLFSGIKVLKELKRKKQKGKIKIFVSILKILVAGIILVSLQLNFSFKEESELNLADRSSGFDSTIYEVVIEEFLNENMIPGIKN